MRHPGIVPLLVGPGYTRGDTHGTSRSRLLSPACSSWTSFCFCGQMAAVTCRTARRQPLERLMRTALALDPTQRITTLIIVLLNEPTLPAEVRNTCMGGLFVFQSAARAPSTSNLPVLTCRLLLACTSRRTRGTVYLYHVLGETQLPVSIFTPHGTSGAVELSRSHVMACVSERTSITGGGRKTTIDPLVP